MEKVKPAQYVPKEDPKDISDKASRELEEALNPIGMVKELYNKARGAFGGQGSVTDRERKMMEQMVDNPSRGRGSVTEREKSITVSPGKKRGGAVR